MKLVREHINEKFKRDSDPIEDIGIGGEEIDFYEKAKELIYSKRNGFENWIKYIKDISKKQVYGTFKLAEFDPNHLAQSYYNSKSSKTLIINVLSVKSYGNANLIFLINSNNKSYYAIPGEKYFLYK